MKPFRFEDNYDTLIAAFTGFIIVLLFSQHGGIGISPDSIAYTSAARNFLQGNDFIDYSNHSLVLFPLFYPFFLSVVMFITRQDIIAIAPYLNALLFASVITISGIIMERFKYKTSWYKRILLAVITLSPSLIEIYTMLWSETLFILLSLVFILAFHHYFSTHKLHSIVICALIAAMAFDTRYAGITLIGTGGILLLFDKNLNWKRKLLHGSVFVIVSSSLGFINLLRNELSEGLAVGMRQRGVTPLMNNVSYSGNVLSEWINIHSSQKLFFELLALAVIILFLIFFIKNIRHWKAYYTFENIAVSFFIVYVLFIVISSTLSRYETINNRLLAPAFLSFVWISTCQLPKWKNKFPHKILQRIYVAFAIGLGLLLTGSYIAINADNLSWMQESGIPGYSEDEWAQSQTMHYLSNHKEVFDHQKIYSNQGMAVYFYTNLSVQGVPEKAYKNELQNFRNDGKSYLIWFNSYSNKEFLSLQEIAKMKHLHLTHAFNDGLIFSMKKK